jgi:hypothetical protein
MIKHIAGIIPVSGINSEILSPVGPALLPISLNYLAIERAVVECAYAGCDTIWVVCDDDTKPLIRHALGDHVYDPVYANRTRAMFPNELRRLIKIYYVPVGSRFYKQKNVWLSILAGCLTSNKISAGISKWLKPTKYYVSFPLGVYDPEQIKAHRPLISSGQNFCFSCDGKSAVGNHYLGVSFTPDVLDSILKKYSHDRFNDQKIKIFEAVDDFKNIDIENYHSIETWNDYLRALKTPLEKPRLFPKAELNGMGVEDDV